MKLPLIFFLFILISCSSNSSQPKENVALALFENSFGKENSASLNRLTFSMDKFIASNYDQNVDLQEKTKLFIADLDSCAKLKKTCDWKFNEDFVITTIEQLQNDSLYSELYDTTNALFWSRPYGKFTQSLLVVETQDTIVKEYLESKFRVGQLTINSIANYLNAKKIDYGNPFLKRILAIEVFYPMMRNYKNTTH